MKRRSENGHHVEVMSVFVLVHGAESAGISGTSDGPLDDQTVCLAGWTVNITFVDHAGISLFGRNDKSIMSYYFAVCNGIDGQQLRQLAHCTIIR